MAGKGNQQILAAPVALWVTLMLWSPGKKTATSAVTKWLPGVSCGVIGLTVVLGVNTVDYSGHARESVTYELAHADALVREGELGQALGVLELLVIPDDMPLEMARRHHNCGVILLQLCQPDRATPHLLLSLRYDPRNAQAAYLLAQMAVEKGSADEALAMLDMALSIRPDYEPAQRLRRNLATQAGPASKPGE